MHSSTLRGVLEHLRKLTDPDRGRELRDGDLLDRFRLHREESAFTLLLQRHGPMVFNVCRRILGDGPEAEDAFQSAFLVLIRKAGTIRKEAALSSWLHVVATRVSHKAAMQSARRRACEREAIPPQERNNSFDALAAATCDAVGPSLPATMRQPHLRRFAVSPPLPNKRCHSCANISKPCPHRIANGCVNWWKRSIAVTFRHDKKRPRNWTNRPMPRPRF
jgi:RNA polymerase sigma factor (sigma-70 family)